jgi:2,3-bisphosphoglycerate-dependent phosphoglycerate mutase
MFRRIMNPCLLLVRHAQSANNSQAEELRVPDPTITKLGELQSKRLAEALVALKPTVLLTSPFIRSIQTARPVAAQTGLRPSIRQDLYEQGGCYRGYRKNDRHPMPGMNRTELEAHCPSWDIDARIGDSGWNDLTVYEDMKTARERAHRVADWFTSSPEFSSQRVAMVIHADFKIRLLEAFLKRDDLEDHLGEVVNTAITKLSLGAGRWKLDFWNSHQHLEAEHVTK